MGEETNNRGSVISCPHVLCYRFKRQILIPVDIHGFRTQIQWLAKVFSSLCLNFYCKLMLFYSESQN